MGSTRQCDLEALRADLAAASRRLAAAGSAPGTAGNLSARQGDLVAVTPTGARLADLTAEAITVVDLDGHVVSGSAPTSELDLHLGIYRRYGAGAVVHAHGPAGTALSCVLETLPCIHYSMVALGDDVRVARYRTFGTRELAAVTLGALEGRAAALMANHGSVTYGSSLEQAMQFDALLEWACQLYVTASGAGTPRALTAAERDDVRAALIARHDGATQPV